MEHTETNRRRAANHELNLSNQAAPTDVPDSIEREEEIERLAIEIGRLIHAADPESREELAANANALLREEGLRAGVESDAIMQSQLDARQNRINPLAAGIGLMVLGGAMTLLLPFVGIALAAIGAIATVWGLVISWRRDESV